MKKCSMLVLLLGLIAVVSGCSVTINGREVVSKDREGNSIGIGTYTSEEENITEDGTGIEELRIKNHAGKITIVKAGGNNIEVNVIKKVRGVDNSMKREVLKNIKINVEKNGKELSLEARTKEGYKIDFWKWMEKQSGMGAVLQYSIRVPEGVKVFFVENEAGDIRLEDIAGTVDIASAAGNVELDGVYLLGDSNIKLGAGNINMDVDVTKAGSLSVRNSAGNISLKLPEDSSFELNADANLGVISGNFIKVKKVGINNSLNDVFNEGNTKIELDVAAGNIIIDKR